MDNEIAKDAIMDAIENRRLAKQPYDAGLEKALEIILTPITEYPVEQALKGQPPMDKGSELEKAAKKCARTGNRTDLQAYLRLRRKFL